DPHHVADFQRWRDFHVDPAYLNRRRMEEITRFEIAVFDDIVAFAILTIADGRDRLDPVIARVERRHRNREVVAAALAGPRKGEARRWGRRAPSGRQLQRQQSTRSLIRTVRELDANRDCAGLARSALSSAGALAKAVGGVNGNNRGTRRDVYRNRGHD